ncbi:hypothetical protein A2954_06580 [Candidatus Roizmanbacteria bacterium RIFCSPLOWO2_01_FULL_37_12]|uniref:Uncharacterized protein n=1 Tax=Candidatus Roizmanbacteria bacterium RIFCSPLOWO2_01_FULL_37_12 TaxID=1802056 RepID=A0A1F7I8I3_9BACT|nr:MAG: hypothetical protein A2768_00150 [Candidatus Roizmanbacteria bacterium RIFCSPHIGHO2_01_FULL_37_16]OGK39674.1 MAG: hypothetical protein A2954_06580 [Candidatus Roizmanbacteria bacterium RIFCSPLOWO2_01_FULL_37_12]
MKISVPRREIYKQNIRTLLLSTPRINNLDIAHRLGLHRNTISKLVEEIKEENQKELRNNWEILLKDLLKVGKMRLMYLEELWSDYYLPCMSKGKAIQMVNIINAYWKISMDMYKKQLEFNGIKDDLKALIQVNLSS